MGIHGTHTPECIGTRSTEGCIRMRNEDLDALHASVKEGMRVIIEPGDADKATDLREGEMPEEVKAAERERLAEQTVVVEEKRQEEAKAKEVWHTVKDGDLVGAIARKYGTTVSKIKELNPSLNVDRISINQRIRVKRNRTRSSSLSTCMRTGACPAASWRRTCTATRRSPRF